MIGLERETPQGLKNKFDFSLKRADSWIVVTFVDERNEILLRIKKSQDLSLNKGET